MLIRFYLSLLFSEYEADIPDITIDITMNVSRVLPRNKTGLQRVWVRWSCSQALREVYTVCNIFRKNCIRVSRVFSLFIINDYVWISMLLGQREERTHRQTIFLLGFLGLESNFTRKVKTSALLLNSPMLHCGDGSQRSWRSCKTGYGAHVSSPTYNS